MSEYKYSIGVVIPLWHGRESLPHALDTLVAQTFQNFIICLSNDNDGEDYNDIATEYARRGLRIEYIERRNNGGPGMARQSGIDHLIHTVEYIVFMDQDDAMMAIGLEYLYQEIKTEENCDVAICTFIEEQPGQYVIHPGDTGSITHLHGKIYKTEFLERTHMQFTDKIFWSEDCYFNVAAINCAKTRRVNTIPVYLWRYNYESATHKNFSEFFVKAWDTFIASQVLALLKVEKEMPERCTPTLCGAVTKEMFVHYMNGLANGIDESRVMKWFDLLKQSPMYSAAVTQKEFWEIFMDPRTDVYVDMRINKWYVPTENKLEWFKRVIGLEVWNDIYC